MKAVLDASAAIKVVLRQGDYSGVEATLGVVEEIYAPPIYLAEVANVLWKYVNAGVICRESMGDYLESAIDLVDEFIDVEDYLLEATHEAMRLNHSVYDMLYFVLARRKSADLITFDKKLNKLVAREGVAIFVEG